jgi:glycosyltransferase involved in cell wall biosynthesis
MGEPIINIVIPTTGHRPEFVNRAVNQMHKQTLSFDNLYVVTSEFGLTGNYKTGFDKCTSGVMFCIEDDDYYTPEYIEKMMYMWEIAGQPELFGLSKTVYYHIFSDRYIINDHPKHSSMMSTILNVDKLRGKIQWPHPKLNFLDLMLWRQKMYSKASVDPGDFINIGIKHGIGPTGGGGHFPDWPGYNRQDVNKEFLRQYVDEYSIRFYRKMKKLYHIEPQI